MWKIFSKAVLTLNFDLDLSKVNSDMMHIDAKAAFHEKRTCAFTEITFAAALTN